jgi:hypothetical protein
LIRNGNEVNRPSRVNTQDIEEAQVSTDKEERTTFAFLYPYLPIRRVDTLTDVMKKVTEL